MNLSNHLLSSANNLSYSLSSLLPYDPAVKINDRLKAGLKEYLLILNATHEAMLQLEQGNLKFFDPLVGENSCQIRAIKLAITIINCSFDIPRLLADVLLSKSKIEQALSHFSKIQKRKTSLKYFLENEGCEIFLSKAEQFLIKSFILTRTKVLKEEALSKPLVKNDTTDSKKIKEFGDVGSLFAKNFVTHLRQQLSETSVQFVQRISKDGCQKNSTMVSDHFLVEHNKLHCIPCFWSTKIALEEAKSYGTPIVMQAQQKAKDQDYKIVDTTTIYFESTPTGYKRTTRCKLDPEIPALVLLGTTCRNSDQLPSKENWIEELSQYCPTELITAYAAAHRQYPDESKEAHFFTIDDQDYHSYKSKAFQWGCSLENPSLFFLAHAFCDKVKNLKHV